MKHPFLFPLNKTIDFIILGNDRIGKIALRKYGYILTGEQAAIEAEIYAESKTMLAALELMSRIMQEKGWSKKEAADFLDNPSNNLVVANDYKNELAAIVGNTNSAKLAIAQITAILQFRTIDPAALDDNFNLKPECCSDGDILPQYLGMPDWKGEDTKMLAAPLTKEITAFINSEKGELPKKKETSNETSKDSPNISTVEKTTGRKSSTPSKTAA